MRILLIDDDDNKVAEVSAHIERSRPSDRLTIKRSFQSGLKELVLSAPDILILDMTMPTYDIRQREPGGRERRYAGKEILRQMRRRSINVPTVIITQYEQFEEEEGSLVTLNQLSASLEEQYSGIYRGTVYYQASGIDWMSDLEQWIQRIVEE